MTSRFNQYVFLSVLALLIVLGMAMSSNSNPAADESGYYYGSSVEIGGTPGDAPAGYYYLHRAIR